MELILIPILAVLSAWSGGSLYGHQWFGRFTWIPEALFSLCVALPWFFILEGTDKIAALIIAGWAYGWVQAGTANGLHWGAGVYKPSRDTSFSPIVNWLSDRLNYDRSSVQYCRLFFAVKGFLITLPVGGLGVIGMPLGYQLGNRYSNTARELLSGAFIGLAVYLFWIITS